MDWLSQNRNLKERWSGGSGGYVQCDGRRQWWDCLSFIGRRRIYTDTQTHDHLHNVKYSTYMRSAWWANQNIHLLYDLLARGSMTVKITFTRYEKYVHITVYRFWFQTRNSFSLDTRGTAVIKFRSETGTFQILDSIIHLHNLNLILQFSKLFCKPYRYLLQPFFTWPCLEIGVRLDTDMEWLDRGGSRLIRNNLSRIHKTEQKSPYTATVSFSS